MKQNVATKSTIFTVTLQVKFPYLWIDQANFFNKHKMELELCEDH